MADEETVEIPRSTLIRLEHYLREVHYGYYVGPNSEQNIKDDAGPLWALVGGALET